MTLRSIRRTTLLLTGLCLALAGGVILEWLKPPQLASVSGEAAQPGQPLTGREPVSGNVSLPPISKYEEIVSRPLFLADRRPPPEMPETPTKPEEQETTLWLVGVMLSPEGQRALMYLKEENRLVRLQVGESAGGWKLESLNPLSATLSRDDDTLELQLERNRKEGPPAPQAAPQPPQPRTARQAPAAAQPQQASAQKGARAPAAAPQQAGRQAPTPPAASGRPGPAPGARQPVPQAPAAGRTAAAPARPAVPSPARPAVPPPARPAAPSPRLQQQLDAITPEEEEPDEPQE